MKNTFEREQKNENKRDLFAPQVDFSSLNSEKSDDLRSQYSTLNLNYFGLGNLELL